MLLEEEKLKLIKWYMGDYVYNDGMLFGGGGGSRGSEWLGECMFFCGGGGGSRGS